MKPQKTLFPKLLLSLMLAVVCLLVLPAQAEAATFDGGSVQLEANLTEDVAVSADTYLDLNGFTLTGDVTVADGATLYVFDSATADYTAENRGKIVGTVTGNLARTMNTPETNYKYLTLQEADGSYSSHRYYLTVKSVVLVPYTEDADCASTAMNYKTVFKCNDVMAEYVTAYGVKLTGDDTVYTNHLIGSRVLTTGAEGVNKHTTRLAGIMKSTNTTEENAANALLAPVVNAYINIDDGLEAEITSADVTRSLKDMILYANGLAELTAKQEVLLDKMNELFEEVIESWTEPADPDGTELSIEEAIAKGTAMEHDTYTETKYQVTGVITEVYNTTYGNMKITDDAGNILTIYGTYDADGTNRYDAMGTKPVAGDTVTVYGVVGQYNGTPQIKNGWIVEHIPDPDAPVVPEDPDGTVLTIEKAIAKGTSMAHNNYTSVKYKVTGVVAEVYDETYGNMYIADEAGNLLNIYGTYSADGSVRYDAMEVKPVAGDTVTIYGVVGQYSNAAQIKNGWIVEHIVNENPDVPEEPEDPTVVGVTISFADSANRTSWDTSTQVWAQNGITVTNNKGTSTSNVADYTNPARFYKNSQLIVAYPGMTTIVFDANNASYASALKSSMDGMTGITVTVKVSEVTVELEVATDSFTIESLTGGQVRMDAITVYAAPGGNEGGETDPTDPVVPEDPDPTDPTDPEPTDPTDPEPTDPSEPGTEPEGPTAPGYVKVTSVDEITTGKYVLVTSNKGTAPTYLDGTWVLVGTPAVENDAITEANAAGFIWDLTVDGTAVKLTDAKGVSIAPSGGNNNGIKSGDYSWNMIVNADGTVIFAGVGSDTVYLAGNTGSDGKFRGYKSATASGNPQGYPHTFILYKLVEA